MTEKTREKLFSVTIKDCRVDTFRSGGKGGQNQNKVESGVRVVHEPSGAIGESREYRDQPKNKRAAFTRMAQSEKFQRWARQTACKLMGKETIEDRVERLMQPQNLLVEVFDGKQWKSEKEVLGE